LEKIKLRRVFMRKVSVKDFIIGAMAAMLLMMLLGAGPDNNSIGRYVPSVGGGGGGYSVCVTDSLTGDTRCYHRGLNDESWAFTPDFTTEPEPEESDKSEPARDDLEGEAGG
jgi:hypothetical protein